MNQKQACLLQLVKEIDAFCKKHDITYYCAAGTVLGAIRHNGFIPWDDDIDLLMTRSEFLRFADAFESDGPAGRTLEYFEADHDHHSTVARYVMEDSCMFCHYHMTDYASAGILIDIFVLDPIPDGFDARHEHIAKFYAYSDLVAPTLCHSNRLPEEYEHVYDEVLETAALKGCDETALGLAEELFSHDEDDCSCYMLRWGSQPFIYPKEFFGRPEYLGFEDMMIPVPSKWPQYLVSHYSFGWTDIPRADSRDQHVTIFDPDRDYHEVYVLRDSMYDQDELLRLHRGLQAARRKADSLEHALEPNVVEMHSRQCLDEVRRGAYETYVRTQTSPEFMGGHMHGRYYHWLFPLVIPVDEEELGKVLKSLLDAGRLTEGDKLTGIYERAGKCSGVTGRVRSILDKVSIAAGLYYSGDHAAALSYIQSVDGHEEIPALRNYEWLSLAATGLSEEHASELKALASDKGAAPELLKAWGDHLCVSGQRESAETVYRELMRTSRNGMFLKDIQEKGFDIEFGSSEEDADGKGSTKTNSGSAKAGLLRRVMRAAARRIPGREKKIIREKAFRHLMGDSVSIEEYRDLPWYEYGLARKEVSSLDRQVRSVWLDLLAADGKLHANTTNK